jgi:hypothetical protein
MRFLDKIFGKKKAGETFIGERPDPTDNPPTERPTLTEGNTKGGNGHVKETGVRKKPNSPPPSPTPKKRKKKTITTKKRSVKKMAGEIVYEYVQCKCEDWKTHLPQIVEQQQYAVKEGRKKGINLAYNMKPFVFCPWCGYKRYRSNRGKKASK